MRKIAPETNVPAGITTTPPPALAAAAIDLWMLSLFTVVPSATAPYPVATDSFTGGEGSRDVQYEEKNNNLEKARHDPEHDGPG